MVKNNYAFNAAGKFIGLSLLALCGVVANPVVAQEPTCKVGVNITVIEPDCGASNGTVIFLAYDGVAPYIFLLNGVQVTGEYSGISEGYYTYVITDQQGCFVEGEFTVTCEDDCFYTTYTMGGWGAVPKGGNPGTFLHANFASAFPGGLFIGCDRILSLSSAQAVTDFLPSGSTPSVLAQDLYQNPGTTYSNVLAGQLVAATLSVTFDALYPGFGQSEGLLGDLEIATGPFAGWTVNQLLQEANLFIGNCTSSYTASDLNDALSNVNESFVDGAEGSGFLLCPVGGGAKSMQFSQVAQIATDRMILFPVPAQDQLQVSIEGTLSEAASMRIMDQAGRIVADLGRVQFNGTMSIDVSMLHSGAYLLVLENQGSLVVERFSVIH